MLGFYVVKTNNIALIGVLIYNKMYKINKKTNLLTIK